MWSPSSHLIWLWYFFILLFNEFRCKEIPSDQFKILNFTDDLWHPHLSKAQLDDTNFVLVDNFKEHRRKHHLVSRLQLNQPSEQLGHILNQGFYDDELSADTELPGQNATNKGPFNWACKFTLADAPRRDSNNFETLINQNGEVEDGMLGEYVNLYDSNRDVDGDNTVPISGANTVAAPTSTRIQTK